MSHAATADDGKKHSTRERIIALRTIETLMSHFGGRQRRTPRTVKSVDGHFASVVRETRGLRDVSLRQTDSLAQLTRDRSGVASGGCCGWEIIETKRST